MLAVAMETSMTVLEWLSLLLTTCTADRALGQNHVVNAIRWLAACLAGNEE